MKRLCPYILFILFILFCSVAIVNQDLVINGKLTVDSISYKVKPAAVSAFVRTSGTTTTSSAGQWYFVKATFVNEDSHSFGFTGDTLKYLNGNYGHLDGMYSFSSTSDVNGTTLDCAVFINNTIDSTSISSIYMKTATEPYKITGCISHTLMHDDKVKIMYRTNKAGANIVTNSGGTFLHQIP